MRAPEIHGDSWRPLHETIQGDGAMVVMRTQQEIHGGFEKVSPEVRGLFPPLG